MTTLVRQIPAVKKPSRRVLNIHDKLKAAIADSGAVSLIVRDLTEVLSLLQCYRPDAKANEFIEIVAHSTDLVETEKSIRLSFCGCGGDSIITPMLGKRAELVLEQIRPYLPDRAQAMDLNPRIVDIGCGDGQVTDLIYHNVSRLTEGFDVCSYRAPRLSVPTDRFNGIHIPRLTNSYDFAVMTNVLHHAELNGWLLTESRRLLRPHGRIIVIETIPANDTPEELHRMFFFDWLYNRGFHNSDIPVPGAYETDTGWIKRFNDARFKLVQPPDHLGRDQPLIPDWHILYVFEKE